MSVRTGTAAAAVALTLCSLSGQATAQEKNQGKVEVQTAPGRVSVDVDATRDRNKATNRASTSSAGMAHRASEIDGMTVKNTADKKLATIKDIVIDVRSGNVKYAALSYGGVLGIGDKLFAVPWAAFDHQHDVNEKEHTLILNVDEKTLKGAPGFDQDNWPNFADNKLALEIDKHYGELRGNRARRSGIDIKAGPVDVEVDIRRNETRRETTAAKDVVHRAADIVGMTVHSPAGKDLGSVNDLVIDMDSGKVRYAALSYGGFLGLGDKLFAVPWNAFGCKYNASDEEYQLTLDVNEATLRKAPGFDQDSWPDLANPEFAEEIDGFYRQTRRDSDADRRER